MGVLHFLSFLRSGARVPNTNTFILLFIIVPSGGLIINFPSASFMPMQLTPVLRHNENFLQWAEPIKRCLSFLRFLPALLKVLHCNG